MSEPTQPQPQFQGPYQPPPTQQTPPLPGPQPVKQSSLWTSKPMIGLYAGIAGLLLGAGIGAGAGGGATPTAEPAPTTTVTVTSAPDRTEGASEPTEAPTSEVPAGGYTAHKSDWKVGVKVKEKQCFGSAGCSVTVTIDPKYVGATPLPDTGTIEVTYEISGDTSGPVVGTFTVEDHSASFDKETQLDTKSSSVTPKAKVTDVEYTE